MCGCNIGKMARKRKISGLGDAVGIATNLLPLVGGFILGSVIEKQFLSGTTYGHIVKLGGGIALASMTKGMISQAGVGMALNGAVDFIQENMPTIGLLPPGVPARYIAGSPFPDGQQYFGY